MILGLYLNGLYVTEALNVFESLAIEAFMPRKRILSWRIGELLGFLISMFADSQYSAGRLENALKRTFGSDCTMIER